MSAKPTGYGLMQIGGQPRPFLVGFEQADIFCRLLSRRNAADGGPMTLQDYNNLFNLVALRENKLLPADVYDFIYSALASGAVEDDLLLDYTPRIVGQWLGEAEDAGARWTATCAATSGAGKRSWPASGWWPCRSTTPWPKRQ